MTPEAAYEHQIEMYRAMTDEQRLQIALNLHELDCNVTRDGIRHQNRGFQSWMENENFGGALSCPGNK